MWNNLVNQPDSLSVSCDLSIEKKSDTEMKIEKSFNLESDTDFQSFVLPLEKDFTKSSKGYASLIVTIPDKEIKSLDYENKLEESEINMMHREKISVTKYIKNSEKIVPDSSYSSDCNYIVDTDNLCHKKYTKITQLENVEDSRIICSKTSFTKRILEDVKSDDDESSNSSDTDSSFNGCNNSIIFDDFSDSDDSVIFSENVTKWCETMKIKETSVDSSRKSNIEDNSFENTSIFLSKNFSLDLNSVNLQESSIIVNRNFHNLLTVSSEGYVNASFEDNNLLFQETSSVLKSVNESWNDSMKNISEEPHTSKKVSFLPLPDLVSIYSYEPEDDNYRYSLYVLDQLRFQDRIKDFEYIISPYLTPEYRASIYRRNCREEI